MESDSKNNEQLLNNEEQDKEELEKKEENENTSQNENDNIESENKEKSLVDLEIENENNNQDKSDNQNDNQNQNENENENQNQNENQNENQNQNENEKEKDNLEDENKNENLDEENLENKSKISNNEENLKEKIKGKYDDLSVEELIEITKKKNNNLIELNEEKEQNKVKLNSILKELNELISENQNFLYGKEQDLYSIEQLKRQLELRKKDLLVSKKANQTFKSQVELFSNKVNNVLSPEKIGTFEEQIDEIKKENMNINFKIKELKNKSIINSKELNICATNKKFPLKIKGYTDDVKSFANIKHDYYNKLNMNKRSLDNLIKEKEILERLYNANIKSYTNENFVSKLNFWLELIKNDLNGTREEIMERIEKNESKLVKEIDKRNLQRSKTNKNSLYLPIINESSSSNRAQSSSPNKFKNKSIITLSNSKKQYQGIFNKYSFLKDDKNTNSKYLQASVRKSLNSKEELKVDLLDEISNDYDTTTEDDYRDLLGRKEQFIETNSRLENNIKEIQKTSLRKLKNISRSIDDNARRLNSLQQTNELLTSEIINLEKVLELTIQHNEINNEIKHNESKFIKLNQKPINDITVSETSVLKELKDEEKKKNSYLNNNIEEEKIQKNDYSLFHVESNKNIKFGDVSKIVKDDEDNSIIKDSSREKKIQEIKNRYFPIDNFDNNEDENNINLIDNENIDENNNDNINVQNGIEK